MRSLVLGIDCSPRRLGYGLVDLETGEPVACGCESIDLPDGGWHHQQVSRALRRIKDLATWDSDEPRGEIQVAYIENTAKAGKYRQHDAGRAQGIVQAEVERRWPWAPVQFLTPSEWKVLAGLKGNASKAEVMEVAQALALPTFDDPPDSLGQDAADALLIALAGQRRNADTWQRGAA